ncbi:MAG: Hpt domain-containing protein [Clostridiales bacterium]
MARFLDDVDLYKSCFTIFLDDEAFEKLDQALAAKDYKEAFGHAHTLKGVAGNMGLTPIYEIICTMVEALRKNDYANVDEYYAKILKELTILKNMQK